MLQSAPVAATLKLSISTQKTTRLAHDHSAAHVVVEAENPMKLVVGSVDIAEGKVGGNRIQFSTSERLTPEDQPKRALHRTAYGSR